MGVLTKPDLVTEKATHDVVMDLVLGNRNPLKLGYYVVKNRGADDSTSTISDRFAAERDFFMSPPWMAIADRCGIPALKESLRELLMKISKQEIPIVKLEIEKRLRECRLDLEAMGPSRSSQSSQRLFLGRIASRFQAVTQSALNGHYSNDPIFDTVPNMKLVTAIMDLNETLSDVFWRRGHKRRFGTEKTDGEEIAFSDEEAPFDFDPAGYPELSDIICSGNYVCQGAIKGPIEQHIRAVFKFSRGPEVGTVCEPTHSSIDKGLIILANSLEGPYSPLLLRSNQRSGRPSPSLTRAKQLSSFTATSASFLLLSALKNR